MILSICLFIHLFYFSLLQDLKNKDEVDNACSCKQSKREWTQRKRGVKLELPYKLPKQQTEKVEKPVSLRDQLKEKDKLTDNVQRRLEEKELEFDKLETNYEDL